MEQKKVKLTARERNLLIGMLAVVVLFVSWQYYFSPGMERIGEEQSERDYLQEEVTRLEREVEEEERIKEELQEWLEREEELEELLPSHQELPEVMEELETTLFEAVPEVENLRLDEYNLESGQDLVELYGLEEEEESEGEAGEGDRASFERLKAIPGEVEIEAEENEPLLNLLLQIEEFPSLTLVNTIDWQKDEPGQTITFRLFFLQ